MADTKRLLVVLAHPDDESFGSGPFFSRMTREGVEVTLICATNGDAGTVAPEKMNGYASIAELRIAELECAAAVIGFKEVIRFGYGDSGMMQDAAKDQPGTLWSAKTEDVAARIVEVIQRVRPQVVLTFDAYGGYGHPDHIKCHLATHATFELLKDDPQRPKKLYYAVFPKQFIQIGIALMRLRGQDPRHMGVNRDLDFQAVLDHVPTVTAQVTVGHYLDLGEKAAACHASQISPRSQFPGGRQLQRYLNNVQRFHRALPPQRPNEPLEFDLFSGLGL